MYACLAQTCIACAHEVRAWTHRILAHPLQSVELLRMAGRYTDGPKQAEAHGARRHCMVTRGPTDPKSSRRGAIGAAAGDHSIHQFHSCARSLHLQHLLKSRRLCPTGAVHRRAWREGQTCSQLWSGFALYIPAPHLQLSCSLRACSLVSQHGVAASAMTVTQPEVLDNCTARALSKEVPVM